MGFVYEKRTVISYRTFIGQLIGQLIVYMLVFSFEWEHLKKLAVVHDLLDTHQAFFDSSAAVYWGVPLSLQAWVGWLAWKECPKMAIFMKRMTRHGMDLGYHSFWHNQRQSTCEISILNSFKLIFLPKASPFPPPLKKPGSSSYNGWTWCLLSTSASIFMQWWAQLFLPRGNAKGKKCTSLFHQEKEYLQQKSGDLFTNCHERYHQHKCQILLDTYLGYHMLHVGL